MNNKKNIIFYSFYFYFVYKLTILEYFFIKIIKQNNQNYYNSYFNVKLWYKIYYFNIIYYDRKYNGWNIQEYHNTFYILISS